MWNTVRVKSEDCVLKITESGGIYEFFLSNLKCIWKNKLTEREILDIIHELNPNMEATPLVLVNKAIASLSERNSGDEIDYKEEPCGIVLNSVVSIGGFPFKFDLKLNLVRSENFYLECTLPLVLMVQTLKEREEKLIGVIKLKDKEIEDYRLGGAQLSHKILKTKQFDEKEHFVCTHDSQKIREVIQSPAKYLSSSLKELFESATKDIIKYTNDEGSSNEVKVKIPRLSPDLFNESDEPEEKVIAVPRKMPTLLKVELKPRKAKSKNKCNPPKKLQI
ncbi:non-homologous end-joining factor 1-like [Hetaerina americana]|uniref:non-homologous end-joining factor 1-like n=1 Tax=Hetaerina americana TaxID=62018 RepID=UPI003A7F2A63